MLKKQQTKKLLIILLIFMMLISIIPSKAAYTIDLSVGLEEAFSNWTPISEYTNGTMKFPGQWSYNSAGYIVNAENTGGFTGFYNPTTNFEDMDITIKMGSWDSDDDTLGCMIRFTEDANHNCTGYIFAFDRGGARHGGLYKITGKQFANANVTQLVSFSSVKWTQNAYTTVRMVASGNNIKVYVNGTLRADYTDPEPIESGSYGFFSYSQAKSRFSSITGYATLAEYTATFDANGGTITGGGATTQNVVSTHKYGELPTVERDGYTFDGWYTNKTRGYKIVQGDTVNISSDTTFYARWIPIKYTVTCIDRIQNTTTELGRSTYQADFDSTTYGSVKGTNTATSAYYEGYNYVNCSSTKVAKSGNIVYRYFKIKEYNITSSGGTSGIISNPASVEYNKSYSVHIIPMSGYQISSVTVDGANKGTVSTYDFWNTKADHTVIATFTKTNTLTSYINTLKTKYSWISF